MLKTATPIIEYELSAKGEDAPLFDANGNAYVHVYHLFGGRKIKQSVAYKTFHEFYAYWYFVTTTMDTCFRV